MRKKMWCLWLGLLVALCLAGSPAWATEPTQDDLQAYSAKVKQYQNELRQYLNGLLQVDRHGEADSLVAFEKRFSVRKKSSSVTRAFRRAKSALQSQVQAYMNSLAQQGYVPVDNPEPISKLDHKWGMSGLKFYVRLKLYLKIWCQKMQ